MAEDFRMDDALRRAIDANVRYYQALGQVTADYVRALAGVWSNVKLPIDLGTIRMPAVRARQAAPAPAPSAAPESAPALVLEAEAGEEAVGVFMVDNSLGRAVSTTVTVGTFRAEDGTELRPAIRVEPAVVALEPGASTLVHLFAAVTDDLPAGRNLRAEVDVPGLAERAIPVVLRRRATGAPPSAPTARKTGRQTTARKVAPKATGAARKAAARQTPKTTAKQAAKTTPTGRPAGRAAGPAGTAGRGATPGTSGRPKPADT
jgi:hypothetical protein